MPFKKNTFQIKEIEGYLSVEILGKAIGLKTTALKTSVIQRTKSSLLYAVNQGNDLHYVRVLYQNKEQAVGLENYVVYVLHEDNEFRPPENAGYITINPNK